MHPQQIIDHIEGQQQLTGESDPFVTLVVPRWIKGMPRGHLLCDGPRGKVYSFSGAKLLAWAKRVLPEYEAEAAARKQQQATERQQPRKE